MDYNSFPLRIATGETAERKAVTNCKTTWGQLVALLSTPRQLTTDVSEYHAMTPKEQKGVKDGPYFVGGHCAAGERRSTNIDKRQILTLDADAPGVDWLDDCDLDIGNECFIYSTVSHEPKLPRLRLVFPLSRTVNIAEYDRLSRYMVDKLGDHWGFDKVSTIFAQAMYLPAQLDGGEFITHQIESDWIDVDQMLVDAPQHVKVFGEIRDDPRRIDGMVGLFNRACGDVHGAISMFLPDIYDRKDQSRYTLIGGTGIDGCNVYDDEQLFQSWHNSDPANNGHNVCSFDLVRIHRFGGKDGNVTPDTLTADLPSHKAMLEFAAALDVVVEQRAIETASMFDEYEVHEIDEIPDELFEDLGSVNPIDTKPAPVEKTEPDELDWMMNPPGILKPMIDEIMASAWRPVPEYAVSGALMCLSLSSMRTFLSMTGAKLNLMMVTVGHSNSGKDNARDFIKATGDVVGRNVYDDMMSAQEILKNMLYDKGCACYCIDEFHGFFGQSKSSSDYLAKITPMVMKLYTDKKYKMNGNDQRVLSEKFTKEIVDCQKKLKPDANGQMISDDEARTLKTKIKIAENLLYMIKDGFKFPQISIYGTTTPAEFDKFFTESALESGLLPRYGWGIPKSMDRVKKNRKRVKRSEFSIPIMDRLEQVGNTAHTNIEMAATDSALELWEKYDDWFEADARLNGEYGSIWGRGGEMVSRIASIVACEIGKVDVEHVEWAFKLTKFWFGGLIIKMGERHLNEVEDGADVERKVKTAHMERFLKHSLPSAMTHHTTNDEGALLSVIQQKHTRSKKHNDVPLFNDALQQLRVSGKIVQSCETPVRVKLKQ